MERIGDLIPDAARRLGLEDELRLARAVATWDALVAERVPPAAGACRLLQADGESSSWRPMRRSWPRSFVSGRRSSWGPSGRRRAAFWPAS